MPEIIIAVDKFDKELSPIEKMEAHYNATLHRAFSILVFNSKNELLLQRRNLDKYHSPGLWTNTCYSHPRFGERLEDAIYRRLKEEMGFTCELKEVFSFIYKVQLEDNLFEHEFDHVFIRIYDGDVIPNKNEVDNYKWINIKQLKEDIKKSPKSYTYWFKVLFDRAENELCKLML
jgi:isopentenyl-diphosphate Delta-isomerase